MYIILAILCLSFLIFIHELGHYFMARRVGMRVETFSIGFGRPIISWEFQGVKWQIGWLLFGGFVKIAGTDFDKNKDPYQVSDGFFGKSPLDRIKVAFMGPFINLIFAFIAFAFLFAIGGREKSFSEFTKKIGWVDPQSELFALGVRPGDEIASYNSHPFQTSKDHLYAPLTSPSKIHVEGYKVDYSSMEKTPFSLDSAIYPHPESLEKGVMTSGILSPANYIIYNRLPGGQENPLPKGAPLEGSGIEYGDRLVWIDGRLLFSGAELNRVLNGDRVLLTIKRGTETFLARVPRIRAGELRPNHEFKEELIDWQFEANLRGTKFDSLYAIPYNLTSNAVVENALRFIDSEKQKEAFPQHPFSSLEDPLQPGDQIIAVAGEPISRSHELLKELQTFKVNIIVERNPKSIAKISWDEADSDFNKEIEWNNLTEIASSIGTNMPIVQAGDLVLLRPVTPKSLNAFSLSSDVSQDLAKQTEIQKNIINSIDDPEKKAEALKALRAEEKKLLLGLPGIQDRKVTYNPPPTALFKNIFDEITRTLYSLFSGQLNPKWMSGPVGIVQVVQANAATSIKEALFWLGAISLNLGLLNLLPIPVLDGGTIVLSLMEMITRRKMNPKVLEKLMIPFAFALIGFFIYLTYNDITRIIEQILYR